LITRNLSFSKTGAVGISQLIILQKIHIENKLKLSAQSITKKVKFQIYILIFSIKCIDLITNYELLFTNILMSDELC